MSGDMGDDVLEVWPAWDEPKLPLIIHPELWETMNTGIKLPKELFEFAPSGRRVVVRCLEPIKVSPSGTIIIPDVAQRRPAVGWILSVGERVGEPDPSLPHCYIGPREPLLGMKVVFGQYAGMTLDLEGLQSSNPYESDFVILTDSDWWGRVWAPGPNQEESK